MNASIYLDAETAALLEAEQLPSENRSQTIARLIRQGSRFEALTVIQVRERDLPGRTVALRQAES